MIKLVYFTVDRRKTIDTIPRKILKDYKVLWLWKKWCFL